MPTIMEPGSADVLKQAGLSQRISEIYRKQQEFFNSGATRSHAFRKTQLKKLWQAVKSHEQEIIEALHKDFSKASFETYGTEIGPVYTEFRHVLRNLKNWMRPQKVATPLPFRPSTSWIYPDSLGVTLIISPWNYPFLLLMRPLISAMAGGNTMFLKPSEISAHTSALIRKIITRNFDESYIAVFEGDGETVGRELITNYHFDHIFFTGSVPVGRKIMEMAAVQLSPVTLELGGKSPCIVDKDANLDFAAKKVAWSKLVNAGQTCVAPDYLLVHASVKEAFLSRLTACITKMYGENPRNSPDYPRIISDRRFRAVSRYLENGEIIFGGETDPGERYIAPTILDGVNENDDVMKEEIFGPVLPVISFNDHREVLDWVQKNPYPLALYIYTQNRKTADMYVENLRFGGGCVNNGLVHLGNPDLPFGGVGSSGIGQSHGWHGFDTFTRQKSVMRTPTWIDAPLWYPPYGNNLKWIRKIFR